MPSPSWTPEEVDRGHVKEEQTAVEPGSCERVPSPCQGEALRDSWTGSPKAPQDAEAIDPEMTICLLSHESPSRIRESSPVDCPRNENELDTRELQPPPESVEKRIVIEASRSPSVSPGRAALSSTSRVSRPGV